MIADNHTKVIVEFELEGAFPWANRHGVPVEWLPKNLEIRAAFSQPQTNERFFVSGRFPDYKELPPIWSLCTEDWAPSSALHLFPKPKQPVTPSSIFITHNNGGVICAPFNRLAYSVHSGPHSDWGNLPQWQTAAPNQIRATTVGDMLQAIRTFLNRTEGRMG